MTNCFNQIIVSVVMPIYNESKYIVKCIDSLLLQDFPKEKMEWIFVDGNSNDNTVEQLKKYQNEYPYLIRIISNPKRIVPCGMNLGIESSQGKYIIRLDAHADYARDYISQCVKLLDEDIADNVGGIAETKANGFVGNTIARMLSSPFGVGNSKFRIHAESAYVDTVPFGAFKREVFCRYGGYDERLVRNQDNELNYRIRKNGGKIFLSDRIHFSYYSRDTIPSIVTMARQNGRWNIITTKLCPGTMSLRHFIPFIFVLSLSLLIILSFVIPYVYILLLIECSLYLFCDLFASIQDARNVKEGLLLCILFPVFHIMYGVGSLEGIAVSFAKEYNRPYNTKYIC